MVHLISFVCMSKSNYLFNSDSNLVYVCMSKVPNRVELSEVKLTRSSNVYPSHIVYFGGLVSILTR